MPAIWYETDLLVGEAMVSERVCYAVEVEIYTKGDGRLSVTVRKNMSIAIAWSRS